jgi:YopT-type cysteine protease-like protein
VNWLASRILGAYVGFVQKSVKDYGGMLTWNFSQVVNPVATLIGTNKGTADGICELLSAKWIDDHAHDSHLSAWLSNGGKAIDPSKIRMLMQLFMIGDSMEGQQMVDSRVRYLAATEKDETNQDVATRNFLFSRGIVRRGSSWTRRWGAGNSDGGAKIKVQLAQDLVDSRGGTGSYRIIGIYGKDGGHCMAAYVGLKDLAFFDPNFGEFWFEDKTKFTKWFTEVFFPRSTYSSSLNKSYKLYDYALVAQSVGLKRAM